MLHTIRCESKGATFTFYHLHFESEIQIQYYSILRIHVNVEVRFWAPGKVCSENTTKGVPCYTSRIVKKHTILQNTRERKRVKFRTSPKRNLRCVLGTHKGVFR